MSSAASQRQQVRAALDATAARLFAAGVPSPAADARAIVAAALGTERLVLALLPPVPTGFEDRLEALVARRERREPLQLVLGRTWFDGLELEVRPGVFIPRPETELLVERAASHLSAAGAERPLVADLCCGTGAIALAIAARLPSARVLAVDLSAAAVDLARDNARRLGVADRVEITRADATDAGALADLAHAVGGGAGAFDAVLTNPPYVPPRGHGDPPLDPEVAEHDPPAALWGGGPDGLELPGALVAVAAELLAPGGRLLLEHDDSQGPALVATARRSGQWAQTRTLVDLAGRDRFLEAVATV